MRYELNNKKDKINILSSEFEDLKGFQVNFHPWPPSNAAFWDTNLTFTFFTLKKLLTIFSQNIWILKAATIAQQALTEMVG